MADVAKKITQIGTQEQVSEQKQPSEPWLRQKNEPALWYMRFKRYLDMSTKRSLRAVVASEPGTQKATKGTEKKLSDVSVPGSWKRASKVWNWVERATAYEVAQTEKQAAHIRQVVTRLPFASKAYRIIELNQMATSLLEQGKSGMSLEDFFTYTTKMQSLLRDIARELEGMDETTAMMADAAANKHIMEQYQKEQKASPTLSQNNRRNQ